MEDVLDVYQRPPDVRRPVVCLDETGKALQASKRAARPPAPGQPAREDYEYVRQGSSNLFLAVAPHLGWRKVRVTAQRTAYDLAEELRQLVEEDFPMADAITLVTDNLNTHSLACLYERFPAEQARRIAAKLEWHYTPEHGSWLNIAEIELAVLARQCLDQRFADQAVLTDATAAWAAERNAEQRTVRWQFTTTDARIKLRRLYPDV
jgi:hypothetical protein